MGSRMGIIDKFQTDPACFILREQLRSSRTTRLLVLTRSLVSLLLHSVVSTLAGGV